MLPPNVKSWEHLNHDLNIDWCSRHQSSLRSVSHLVGEHGTYMKQKSIQNCQFPVPPWIPFSYEHFSIFWYEIYKMYLRLDTLDVSIHLGYVGFFFYTPFKVVLVPFSAQMDVRCAPSPSALLCVCHQLIIQTCVPCLAPTYMPCRIINFSLQFLFCLIDTLHSMFGRWNEISLPLIRKLSIYHRLWIIFWNLFLNGLGYGQGGSTTNPPCLW